MVADSLSQLARALGRDKGDLSRWSKLPWFPARDADGNWNVDLVRAALDANVRSRRKQKEELPLEAAARQAAQPQAPASKTPDARETELIAVLKNPASTPVAIAEAGHALAAYHLGLAAEKGIPGTAAFEGMKKQSEELRRALQAQLELDQQQGVLIKRDSAKEVIGACVRILVDVTSTLENTAALEIEIWISNDEFKTLSVEGRRERVRTWFEQQTRALRTIGADKIEAMVTEAEAEK